MRRRGGDVTEAERAVLEVLWDVGACPVRAVADRLYPDGGASAVATVQKLLERLEAKGFVRRDRGGPMQTFAATLGRHELIDRRVRAVAEELCGGSFVSLLSHLVQGRLSAAERRRLREDLERLEAEAEEVDDPGLD
jgi:predicted transcriptional regulator